MSVTASRAKRPSQGRKTASTPATGWKLRRLQGLKILEAPPLARLAWLRHGISTRPGGVSRIPASNDAEAGGLRPAPAPAALNLGFTEWDSRERVLENRTRFFRALGAEKMRVVTLRQFHSDVVHLVDESDGRLNQDAPAADALITAIPRVLLAVQTADCVPILLADTKRRAIAAIHSGWRGTLCRIAAKALGRMTMEFGTRPEDVVAALGPAIGRCCYEVGPEVVHEFDAQFPEAYEWFDGPIDKAAAGDSDPNWLAWLTMRPPGHPLPSPRVCLDLTAANRAILAAAGVPPERILAADWCTACRSDLLFSYRRERTTGRLMAAIALR